MRPVLAHKGIEFPTIRSISSENTFSKRREDYDIPSFREDLEQPETPASSLDDYYGSIQDNVPKWIEIPEKSASFMDKKEMERVKVFYFLKAFPQYRYLISQLFTHHAIKLSKDIQSSTLLWDFLKFVQDDNAIVETLASGLFDENHESFTELIQHLIKFKQEEEVSGRHNKVLSVMERISVTELGDLFRLIFNSGMPSTSWRSTNYHSSRVYTEESKRFDIESMISVSKEADEDGNYDIVITFPGTKSLVNLFLDFEVKKNKARTFGGKFKIHSGILKAFESIKDAVYYKMLHVAQSKNFKIASVTVSGHSLGACLGVLTYLHINEKLKMFPEWRAVKQNIITVGAPPFGDSDFYEYTQKVIQETETFTAYFHFEEDIFAKPPWWIKSFLGFEYPYGDDIELASLDWITKDVQYNDSFNHHARTYAFATFMILLDHVKNDIASINIVHQIFLELMKENLVNKYSKTTLVFHLLRFGTKFLQEKSQEASVLLELIGIPDLVIYTQNINSLMLLSPWS